jgi:hypothetical protein
MSPAAMAHKEYIIIHLAQYYIYWHISAYLFSTEFMCCIAVSFDLLTYYVVCYFSSYLLEQYTGLDIARDPFPLHSLRLAETMRYIGMDRASNHPDIGVERLRWKHRVNVQVFVNLLITGIYRGTHCYVIYLGVFVPLDSNEQILLNHLEFIV